MKATDIRRGHVIMIDGQPCRVMDFTHRTPGNLRAFVQVRLRNLVTGNTFDTRLAATDFVDEAPLETKEFQVLYRDHGGVHVREVVDRFQALAPERRSGVRSSLGRASMHAAARLDTLGTEQAYVVLAAARRLEAAGHKVVHLEIGEPDMPTPPHVVEAGVRALRDGLTRYALAAGALALREAIARSLAARGVRAGPDNVVVTPGAKPMLFCAALALIEPGVDVLTPDPGFPIYESVVRFAGGRPAYYPLDETREFAPDVAAIARRITPRTRVLILNLPHNPTGGVASARDLEALAELALRHDLWVISDEVYGQIRYDGRRDSIAALPGMAERTVIVDGFSKGYSMTGWRLGFGVMPPRSPGR